VSFHQEEDSIEGGAVLSDEVHTTEAVQILYRRDSNNRYTSNFFTYPSSYPTLAILYRVGKQN
jgi:hypothetical protein